MWLFVERRLHDQHVHWAAFLCAVHIVDEEQSAVRVGTFAPTDSGAWAIWYKLGKRGRVTRVLDVELVPAFCRGFGGGGRNLIGYFSCPLTNGFLCSGSHDVQSASGD